MSLKKSASKTCHSPSSNYTVFATNFYDLMFMITKRIDTAVGDRCAVVWRVMLKVFPCTSRAIPGHVESCKPYQKTQDCLPGMLSALIRIGGYWDVMELQYSVAMYHDEDDLLSSQLSLHHCI